MEEPAADLSLAERELRRIIKTLRKMVKDRGYRQSDLHTRLGWGRSYLSQVFTGTLSLRAEIMLAVLAGIRVHPCRFYYELCKGFDPRIDLPEADATRYARADPNQKKLPMSRQGPEAPSAQSGLVAGELDRLLKSLHKMIKDRGYTQREVQEKYGWHHTRLTQIFQGQIRLYVDTMLAVLFAIGVNPRWFYYELCRDWDPITDRPNLDEYKHSTVGQANGSPKYLLSAQIQPTQPGEAGQWRINMPTAADYPVPLDRNGSYPDPKEAGE
jgi:transcriptional regulator with XRE-family HTH domain